MTKCPRPAAFANRCMNECISKKSTTVRALASKANIELAGLQKAFYGRQSDRNALIHYADRGSEYVTFLYTDRLDQPESPRSVAVARVTTTPRLKQSIGCTTPN